MPGHDAPSETRRQDRWFRRAVLVSVLAIAVVYACVQSLLSANIGQAVFRTGDETGYLDTLTRMHRGLASGDLRDAFSGFTFAYGHLYFLTLAALTALPDALGLEQVLILSMRLANTLLFAGVAATLACLLRRFWSHAETTPAEATPRRWTIPIAAWLLVCTFPCLHTVLVLVKPEMLQALLLLLGVRALWAWHEKTTTLRLALVGAAFGLCIAAKISGVLFLAVPGAYFALHAFRTRSALAALKGLGIVVFLAAFGALLFTDPRVWLFPSSGSAQFLDEFRLFSRGLSASAIAEVDRFTPLASRASVLGAWLTHPYSHGFLCFAAFYALALGALVYAATRELRSSCFPLVSLALTGHLACVAYFLATTTRITSWYFFPSLVLLVPVMLCAAARVLPDRRAVAAVLAILVFVQAGFNLRHAARIIDGVAVQRAADFRREAPNFRAAASFLRNARYPLGQVFVSIDAPLDLSRDELRFWPARFDDPANGPHHTHRFGTFQKYEVGTLVPEKPDVVVFNNTHPQFAQRLDLVGPGFGVLYEDEYATILTRHPPLLRIPIARALELASPWSPPGATPANAIGAKPELTLRWDKPEWQGSMREFKRPVPIPLAHAVVDLELIAPPDRAQDRSLRLIFGGVYGHDPAYAKPVRAAWDAELLARVSPGRQRIRVPVSAFRRSVGEFQWGYVTTMALGGVLSPGTEVRLRGITIEPDAAAMFMPFDRPDASGPTNR